MKSIIIKVYKYHQEKNEYIKCPATTNIINQPDHYHMCYQHSDELNCKDHDFFIRNCKRSDTIATYDISDCRLNVYFSLETMYHFTK